LRVQVRPAQSKYLVASRAGKCGDVHEGIKRRAFESLDKLAKLGIVKRNAVIALARCRRLHNASHGIDFKLPTPHRCTKTGTEGRVNASRRPWRNFAF
jgi:hypothetical protein